MKITIAGTPGSGKTTLGKMLAEKLGIPFYSIGDIFEKMAIEKGMTINELGAYCDKNPSVDIEIDEKQRKMGESDEGFVLDSRMGWYFLPDSIKVFIKVDPSAAAERIFALKRPEDAKFSSADEAKAAIEQRLSADINRYLRLYGKNYADLSNYDIVIDTTGKTPEESIGELMGFVHGLQR